MRTIAGLGSVAQPIAPSRRPIELGGVLPGFGVPVVPELVELGHGLGAIETELDGENQIELEVGRQAPRVCCPSEARMGWG